MSETDTLTEKIKEWTETRADEISSTPSEGFYAYNIVVDAYKKGKGDGREIGKEEGQRVVSEMIKSKYDSSSKLTLEALLAMCNAIYEKGFKPKKLFISRSINNSSILFSVPNETHINDDFLDFAYDTASKLKLEYYDKGLNLQISFLNDSADLNLSMLKSDGYTFSFDLEKKSIIE